VSGLQEHCPESDCSAPPDFSLPGLPGGVAASCWLTAAAACASCLRTGHECVDQIPPIFGGPVRKGGEWGGLPGVGKKYKRSLGGDGSDGMLGHGDLAALGGMFPGRKGDQDDGG
jgi:hypothetical protein